MTPRPPAWSAALRALTGDRDEADGLARERLVAAVAHHLASASSVAVRDWVGDRWPDPMPLTTTVLDALPRPDADDVPEALGLAYEALAGEAERRRGVHYTPAPLARRLAGVGLGLLQPGRGPSAGPPPSVCDPACGGGAFLLGAARTLAAAGHRPADVLAALAGLDLDPLAARVAATALVLWAGVPGAPTVAVGDALAGDAWPGRPADGHDLVLGNPPFQAQLGADTARTAAEAERLRAVLGDAARGYVDTAALFLLVAAEQVRPGGCVLLIQPQSVLASRDGARVRAHLDRTAPLAGLWVCDEPVFEARTRVCAPVLRRRRPDTGEAAGTVARWRGPAVTPASAARAPVGDAGEGGGVGGSWASLTAGLRDVPTVVLGSVPLAEAATASAGFRDQFYGLAPHVREATGTPGEHPLVTAGLIDPATCAWGHLPARYAKVRWVAPVLDLDGLAAEDPELARWVQDRLVPKVLVATQTRVVEAVADVDGDWVPSTPVIAVPAPPDRLWHVLAALLAPPVSAWALHGTAGTALAPDALKLSAALVRRVPRPVDHPAWDEGAAAARAAQEAGTEAARDEALDAVGRAMVAAHGLSGGEGERVLAWWGARRHRKGPARADNRPVGQ